MFHHKLLVFSQERSRFRRRIIISDTMTDLFDEQLLRPNVAAEWLAFLLHIRVVLASYLSPYTGC
jgi:hypothetical protein